MLLGGIRFFVQFSEESAYKLVWFAWTVKRVAVELGIKEAVLPVSTGILVLKRGASCVLCFVDSIDCTY